ncbi:MAG: hypothetical protein H6868_02890 [Rhodospirillales bacterium]|nr:hypothetical protein [Rhodospirillales bacterium]
MSKNDEKPQRILRDRRPDGTSRIIPLDPEPDDLPADYEVGYGKPPVKNQFKPGESGNPKGRPPRSENFKTIAREILDEQISIQQNGRRRTVTTRRALVMALIAAAMKGDRKAMEMLKSMDADVEDFMAKNQQTSTELTAGDQEILNSYSARIASNNTEGN